MSRGVGPDPLRQAATRLETGFLSEMLKAAGLGETPGAFGGGAGEEQFASLLRHEHAKALAAQGGIGLAESIYNTLKEQNDV
ncbi:flagellar protein FlgJ, putative [Salipiger mucosus DSM 16094]|uniref:Flagellar protein FlgJ, putative n=1 Tax=Salipiger mucosus DSM 16094 TaxID=1123237 RepID=S9QSJ4_9RHOB|nr:flagellar protein FlgJ, putative [Salipiger mucosus DSM 16094]